MSGEHGLIPSWAVKLIRQHDEAALAYHARTGRWHDNLDTKVQAVCKACNAGWISDLDARAQAAIGHDLLVRAFEAPAVIVDGIDVSLSRWAGKTLVNRALMGRLSVPAEIRAFCVATDQTLWSSWPFRLLWSFGRMVVDGNLIPTSHFRSRTAGNLEYRCFGIGSFHFHMLWDEESPAREPMLSHVGDRLHAARGAQPLPTTTSARTVQFTVEDHLAVVARKIKLAHRQDVFAALEAAFNQEFAGEPGKVSADS